MQVYLNLQTAALILYIGIERSEGAKTANYGMTHWQWFGVT
jgi:hypothetical protein